MAVLEIKKAQALQPGHFASTKNFPCGRFYWDFFMRLDNYITVNVYASVVITTDGATIPQEADVT